MSKAFLYWIAAGLTIVVAVVGVAYQRDMKRSYERVRGHSKVVASPYGDIEYSEANWHGYKIVPGRCEGLASGGSHLIEKGPMVSIRHPNWGATTGTCLPCLHTSVDVQMVAGARLYAPSHAATTSPV